MSENTNSGLRGVAGAARSHVRAAVVLAAVLGLALGTTTAQAALIQDFDSAGTPYTSTQGASAPGPLVLPGGPTANYLRLTNDGVANNRNAISFDRASDAGVSNSNKVTFDFYADSPSPDNPADGFSVLFLPTAIFGDSGLGVSPTSFNAETPNVPDVMGVGFNVNAGAGTGHISLWVDGTQIGSNVVPVGFNLVDAVYHRAEVQMRQVAGGSEVTVTITPDIAGTPGTPFVAFNNQLVPGLVPMDYRVEFAGRTGGRYHNLDLDNISSGVAPGAQPASTLVDFDGVNTQYKAFTHNTAVHAAVMDDAGSDGNFLRLMHNNVNNERNSLAIDRAADGGVSNTWRGTFDFRADGGSNPADGFSLLMVPTAVYGDTGAGISSTTWVANKPNIADTFGIGFSFYQAAAGVNDVSIHWNGAEIQNVRLDPAVLDLDAAVFHRAEVIARHVAGGSNVTINITPDVNGTPGTPVNVVTDLFVAGLVPYDYRMEFAARSGGANMNVDLDSISSGVAPLAQAGIDTVQDFDGGGSQYKTYTYYGSRHATIEDVGGSNVLRLLHSVNSESNGVAFDRTAAGLYGTIEADWDFSMLAGADGGAFGLINTADYGTSGQGPYLSEEPNVSQMFAIGFDVYSDIHDISLHWNGAELAQVGTYDYRGAGLKHAHALIEYVTGGANVSVEIDGTPIFTNQFIAGMVPYESRVGFGGRTGGVNTTFDLDNINVQYQNAIAVSTDPFHWKGAVGNYPDNTMWTNDILPTGNDHAFIELGIANSSNLSLAGTGSLTVAGIGTLNNSGVLRVGAGGTPGTLNQSGGAVQTSTDLYVADGGSHGSTYSMTGGTLIVGGAHTVVGRSGVGHFLQDGGEVSLRRLFVAEFGGSGGSTYTLNDGTLTLSQRMEVGRHAAATFTQTGGTVNATGALTTDDPFNILVGAGSNAGVYNLQGGVLNVGLLQKGANGQFNFTGGRLNAETVDFDLTNTGGTLAPGNSPGVTTINGNYVQLAGGTFEVDIEGLDPGTGYDRLIVNGEVTLDGTLDVLLGFAPPLGEEFIIIDNDGTSDPVHDQFAGLPEGSLVWADYLGVNYSFRLTYEGYDGNDVVLSSVPEPAACTLLAIGLIGLLGCGRRLRSGGSRKTG